MSLEHVQAQWFQANVLVPRNYFTTVLVVALLLLLLATLLCPSFRFLASAVPYVELEWFDQFPRAHKIQTSPTTAVGKS